MKKFAEEKKKTLGSLSEQLLGLFHLKISCQWLFIMVVLEGDDHHHRHRKQQQQQRRLFHFIFHYFDVSELKCRPASLFYILFRKVHIYSIYLLFEEKIFLLCMDVCMDGWTDGR